MSYESLLKEIKEEGLLKGTELFTFDDIYDTQQLRKFNLFNDTVYSLNEINKIVYGTSNNSFNQTIIDQKKYFSYKNKKYLLESTLKNWIERSRKFEIYKIAMPLGTYSRFYREYMTLLPIMKVFNEYTFVRQYYIPKERKVRLGRAIGPYYSVDLYCKELNLAIECDEQNHRNVSGDDFEREKFIKNKLQCNFLRFNPDDKKFKIQSVIDEIYKYQ